MDQPYPTAMAKLSQSIAVEQPIGEVFPDSPAALVTLAAIHGGDPVRAHSVIGRAVRADGGVLFKYRHLLLCGWIKMQDGQLPSAGADVATVSGARLHRRDALWAAALQTAIARRSGDTGALQKHWYAAAEVLAEYSLDLFALLPLGELWVAAARMRQVDQLQHTLDQAFALLNSLGNPPLWSSSAALGRRARRNPRQLAGVRRTPRAGSQCCGRAKHSRRKHFRQPVAPGSECSPTRWTQTRSARRRGRWHMSD